MKTTRRIVSAFLFSPSKARVLLVNEYDLKRNSIGPVWGYAEPFEPYDRALERVWYAKTGDGTERPWVRFAQLRSSSRVEVYFAAVSAGPLLDYSPQVSTWTVDDLMTKSRNILIPDGRWLVQLALSVLNNDNSYRHFDVVASAGPPKRSP
jgi:hypothetical protein